MSGPKRELQPRGMEADGGLGKGGYAVSSQGWDCASSH